MKTGPEWFHEKFVKPLEEATAKGDLRPKEGFRIYDDFIFATGGNITAAAVLSDLHCAILMASASNTPLKENRHWLTTTSKLWREDRFEFISQETLERVLRKLKKDGVLIVRRFGEASKFDRTNSYSIDYEELGARITRARKKLEKKKA